MLGRSVNLTTLLLGRLRSIKRLTSTQCTFFASNHRNVAYDKISSKIDFQSPGLKIMVNVAIFRKTLSSLWPTFIDGQYNYKNYKMSWAQGQGHCGYF